MSKIEWTDRTWNPSVGCSRVSAGCEHCYAERFVHRELSPSHKGLTVVRPSGVGWTGEVRLVPERLAAPLSWRKPQRVFVNSLSDLFHESLSNEAIAAVFGVMAACPDLTFQVLTKRPERMLEWFSWVSREARRFIPDDPITPCTVAAQCLAGLSHSRPKRHWPLTNVWLGVSVENQRTADERIPLLLETPAALRFVSYEPALGGVDFTTLDFTKQSSVESLHVNDPIIRLDALRGRVIGPDEMIGSRLDWVIVGGESGPGARPFDLAWARSVIEQCRDAGVACFVKQLGVVRGLRRRAVIESGVPRVVILHAIGREDALVCFCPFCGAPVEPGAQRPGDER